MALKDAVRYADVSRCPAPNNANELDAESQMLEGEELRGYHFHRKEAEVHVLKKLPNLFYWSWT